MPSPTTVVIALPVKRFIEDKNSTRAHDLVREASENAVKEQAEAWLAEAQKKLAEVASVVDMTEAGISAEETLRTFLGEGTCRPGDGEFSDLVVAVRSVRTRRGPVRFFSNSNSPPPRRL